VTALDRAFALAEMDDVAVRIAEYLDLEERRRETATGPLIRRPIPLDAGLRRPVTPMTAGTAPRWQTGSDSIEIV
jgi:hypothetical protein